MLVLVFNGQLFFTSVTDFVAQINYNDSVEKVIIDVTHAHLWDDSAVGAIDKIEYNYEQKGVTVEIRGLNKESSQLMGKIGGLSKASGH